MKLTTFALLLLFIAFRNSFTLLQGKRSRKKMTAFIYWGRKIIEIVISFAIPILLLTEVIKTDIQPFPYYLGILLSIAGLLLMAWTRFYRNKDWGFMGDDAGETLFTKGPYGLTRHPYYVGAFLAGVGIYLQLNWAFTLLIIPVGFFMLYAAGKEDAFLMGKFDKKYAAYKKKVGVTPW